LFKNLSTVGKGDPGKQQLTTKKNISCFDQLVVFSGGLKAAPGA
jgi:hypothetical protein